MKTRPAKPLVGEATAIRQVAAQAVPPQDTTAMDDLVEQYSRRGDPRGAGGKDKGSDTRRP
jgi:hypothetical protein